MLYTLKALFPMNVGNGTKRCMDGDQTLSFTTQLGKGLDCETQFNVCGKRVKGLAMQNFTYTNIIGTSV